MSDDPTILERIGVVDGDTFRPARDLAGAIAGVALQGFPDVELLERAIAAGERALSVGPIVDPTLWRDAHVELEVELKVMRAVLAFRREVEELRP